MTDNLLATVQSLTAIMAEETRLLSGSGWPHDVSSLVEAKLRLIGALEAVAAEQERIAPDWLNQLGAEQRTQLFESIAELRDAAAANASVVQRQIDLSQDLLGAIAGEARRLGGASQQTYARSGALDRRDGSAPVAVNTRL